MSYSIIDTHCHLDIIESYGLPIPESLENSRNSGVKKILQVGIDLNSSLLAKKIAMEQSGEVEIFYSIGYHPTHNFQDSEKKEIQKLIHQEAQDSKFVAIGEIGLDYYHKEVDEKTQKSDFREFIELSIEKQVPVIIHSRDAEEDTYQILKDYKDKAFGVIHCFTYNREYAFKYMELGYYISFSGILTFNSAKDIQDAAKHLPLESVLIETDAPFLAPTPFRGKRNEPAYIPKVLEKMFQLRTEDKEKIEKTIYKNSENFLAKRRFTC